MDRSAALSHSRSSSRPTSLSAIPTNRPFISLSLLRLACPQHVLLTSINVFVPSLFTPLSPLVSLCPTSELQELNLLELALKRPTDAPSLMRESRWSDVIPPNTALTFAAIWDPEDGLVSFSGADLLNLHPLPFKVDGRAEDLWTTATDAPDNVSQILTIDRLAMQLEKSYSEPNTAMLAFDEPTNPMSFACEAMLDTEDVIYTGPSRLVRNNQGRTTQDFSARRHALAFKSETEMLHAIAEENGLYRQMGSDEGFYDRYYASSNETVGRRLVDENNLKSMFSTTTTSTSRYVHVASTMFNSVLERPLSTSGLSTWSTLDAPSESDLTVVTGSTESSTRKLHKKRPAEAPSSASKSASDESEVESISSLLKSKPRFASTVMNRFGSLQKYMKSTRDEERWVNVEVTQVVTQRLI